MATREEQSHAAQEARRLDWDRYICALFAPPGAREALFALLTLNGEMIHAEALREPVMGEIRKQWWRDAVAAVYGGAEAPATPSVAALTHAIRDFHLPRAEIDALIDEPDADMLMRLQLRVLAGGNEPDSIATKAGSAVAAAWDHPDETARHLQAARSLYPDRRYHPALLWAVIAERRGASRLRRQFAVGWKALLLSRY